MNKVLWQRFQKANDTHYDQNDALCHACEFAEKTEIIEPRLDPKRWPGFNDSWYAPVDRSTFKPKTNNKQCQSCFDGWVEEKIEEGKICIKCGVWVTKEKRAMFIEEREVGTNSLSSKKAVCSDCFMAGLEAMKKKEDKND